jgi:Tfp pilus assembly protein PilV
MKKALRQRRCGVVLIEALVALLIVSFGIVALGAMQAQFRRSADLARERGDALRLATRELETLRAYASLDAEADSFAAIQPAERLLGSQETGANTDFQLSREVSDRSAILKSLRVQLSWHDRAGDAQQLVLDSFIDGADPGLGFALGLGADQELRGVAARHPGIPPDARDLGDGRSALKPAGAAAIAYVFDNIHGVITSRCSVPAAKALADLNATDLSDCAAMQNGYLLAGAIRFSLDTPPDSEHPASAALPLGLKLVLTSAHHLQTPSYECYSDAPASAGANPLQTLVLYNCLVTPNTDRPPVWSGFLDLSGLAFSGDGAVTVCRYSANYDGSKDTQGQDLIDNPEHPEQYLNVAGPLRNQNFLVIAAGQICPAGHGVDASLGHYTNTATLRYQDAVTPSHAPKS